MPCWPHPPCPPFSFRNLRVMTIAVTEGGCHLLLERRGYHRDAPPRGTLLTAWGQRSDTAGNFLTPSTTFVVRPPPRGATSRKQVFLKATYSCVGRNTGVVEVRRLWSSQFCHGSALKR